MKKSRVTTLSSYCSAPCFLVSHSFLIPLCVNRKRHWLLPMTARRCHQRSRQHGACAVHPGSRSSRAISPSRGWLQTYRRTWLRSRRQPRPTASWPLSAAPCKRLAAAPSLRTTTCRHTSSLLPFPSQASGALVSPNYAQLTALVRSDFHSFTATPRLLLSSLHSAGLISPCYSSRFPLPILRYA